MCMRFVRICMHARARARTFTHVRIRRSSVTVVSRLRAERPRSRGLISGWPERKNVLVPIMGLGTHLTSCGVVTGVFSPWITQSGHEADRLAQSVAQVKNTWSCTFTPSSAFMACCSVKHKGRRPLPCHAHQPCITVTLWQKA